jgi:hypothetical protein
MKTRSIVLLGVLAGLVATSALALVAKPSGMDAQTEALVSQLESVIPQEASWARPL